MKVRLWAALLCAGCCCGADAPPSREVFNKVRENIGQELARATNYTCVEVIHRTYSYSSSVRSPGCGHPEEAAARKPYLRDRLRLDVAVSHEGELFSWHGGKQFSSNGIESVVQAGAASSGTFVGYLQNIFFVPDVVIRYAGRVQTAQADTMTFEFDVPLASSHQTLLDGLKRIRGPFHGSLTVDARKSQLLSVNISLDGVHAGSNICTASFSIQYQIAEISGAASLIPETASLDLDTANHQFVSCQTKFSDCHAFRGESVLHFSDSDQTATTTAVGRTEESLPERTKIHAEIKSRIDSKTSFAGDLVEAVLQKPITLKATHIRIERGAHLEGVITRLEFHYVPQPFYLLDVALTTLVDGGRRFMFSTTALTGAADKQRIREIFIGGNRQDARAAEESGGPFIFVGDSFRSGKYLPGTWVVQATPEVTSAARPASNK